MSYRVFVYSKIRSCYQAIYTVQTNTKNEARSLAIKSASIKWGIPKSMVGVAAVIELEKQSSMFSPNGRVK
jgi:hypothetical protein